MEFRACSDEIPPCSFEIARRLLWRNTNNELLPVYDRQLCECYLQPQISLFQCLGDNKWFLISLKSEFVTQIWVRHSNLREKLSLKFEWRTQIWVANSDSSEIKNHLLSPKHSQRPSLKFEWNRLVSPRFEWTLKFKRSPKVEGITLRSPRIECFTYFWGWSSTCGSGY